MVVLLHPLTNPWGTQTTVMTGGSTSDRYKTRKRAELRNQSIKRRSWIIVFEKVMSPRNPGGGFNPAILGIHGHDSENVFDKNWN